jgi:uncharacterized repeat protein (TIGR03803 family)
LLFFYRTVLNEFNGSNASSPQAPLIFDAAGKLYGTTVRGGAQGRGIVFALEQIAGVWKERVLNAFTDANGDGPAPGTGLVLEGSDIQ